MIFLDYGLAFFIWCSNVAGKQAEFYLHENTRVSGEFRGCDVECSEIFVKDLKTPMGTIPEAILRSGDIIYLDISDINIDQWGRYVQRANKRYNILVKYVAV